MTESQDKLRAMGGVAAVFETYLGPGYFAGLWERDLLHQVLWQNVANRPDQRKHIQHD